MIFVATFGIGVAAVLTRSVLSIVAASVAILATFALAAIAGNGASLIALLIAIAGYNAGLIACFSAELLTGKPAAQAH